MSCTPLTNDKNEVIGFACGSKWGMGAYDSGDEDYGWIYGFAPSNIDPHDFDPDYECNSEHEIEAWETAKKECKCGR
jgi:hypothetical protein